jgi:hypothetical protein
MDKIPMLKFCDLFSLILSVKISPQMQIKRGILGCGLLVRIK